MMTTMAAPTYATTMAAPTYAQAYGTTTMAAAPAYSYAQPMVETVAAQTYAAPQVQYAAAPQVVEYAAPQVQYAAAPQVVEYAAPQVQYAAAPQVVEYAAPQVQYAAAPQVQYATTQVASYVPQPQVTYAQAAPVTTQMASYVAQPAMGMYGGTIVAPQAPMAPMKLTEGIPTPEQIAQQKNGYSAALDKQLKEAIDTVQKETQIEKEMIKFTADKTIALYNMQVDERLTEAVALADEQATFALLELNKAKVERNLQLNAQANGLIFDYQMKAVQTELAQKQYDFQVQYVGAEEKLMAEYNKQVAAANTGTTYAAPPAAVR